MSTSLISQNNNDTDYLLGEGESQLQSQEHIADLSVLEEGKFVSVKEYDIEFETRPGLIPMEDGLFLQLTNPQTDPLRLGFLDEAAEVEIIGWGLRFPSEDRANLVGYLGRRFFELYSRSLSGLLTEQDEAALDVVSRQVDYRSYVAARAMPRYHEATLVRKTPVLLIQFLDDKNIKLPPALQSSLRLIQDGERFGAWFTTTRDGEITAITNPVLLSPVDEAASFESSPPIEFPESLIQQLPPQHRPKA
ncbi:MAG: hypothetical protein JWO08_1785 [Verrucomicrobiaceae bacterium]|nr:hypothetical protein [Verrucomicrobiaceae bacterium]